MDLCNRMQQIVLPVRYDQEVSRLITRSREEFTHFIFFSSPIVQPIRRCNGLMPENLRPIEDSPLKGILLYDLLLQPPSQCFHSPERTTTLSLLSLSRNTHCALHSCTTSPSTEAASSEGMSTQPFSHISLFSLHLSYNTSFCLSFC